MNKPIIAHILHIPGDNSSVVHVWENSLVSGQLSELQAYYHVSEHPLSPNTKDNCGQNNYRPILFILDQVDGLGPQPGEGVAVAPGHVGVPAGGHHAQPVLSSVRQF